MRRLALAWSKFCLNWDSDSKPGRICGDDNMRTHFQLKLQLGAGGEGDGAMLRLCRAVQGFWDS